MTLIAGFLALGTSPDPTVFVEQTGSGYARVAMSVEAISHNRSTNVGSATFTAEAGDWVDVTQYAIYTQSAGGVVRFWWNRSRVSVPDAASLVVPDRSFSLLFDDALYRVGTSTYGAGDVIGRDAANNAITAGSAFAVTSGVSSAITALAEPLTFESVTTGSSPIIANNDVTLTRITTGGTGGEEHIYLRGFAFSSGGEGESPNWVTVERNGTTHVFTVDVQTNPSDVVKIFVQDSDGTSESTSFVNALGQPLGFATNASLTYTGGTITYVWQDYLWFAFNLGEDSNFTGLVMSVSSPPPIPEDTGPLNLLTTQGGSLGWQDFVSLLAPSVLCVTQGTSKPYAFLASTPVSIAVGGQLYGGRSGIYAMDIGFDGDAAITHIAFPGLVGAIWGCSIQSCDNLVAVDLSEMVIAYNGVNLSLAGLVTLDLSSLAVVGDTTFTLDFVVVSGAITALTLPSIAFLSRSLSFATPALASFSFGNTLQYVGGSVQITNAALDQPSVDGILASLVALTTPFTGTVNLSGGTSAAPSIAGAANAAILTGQGAVVTTN